MLKIIYLMVRVCHYFPGNLWDLQVQGSQMYQYDQGYHVGQRVLLDLDRLEALDLLHFQLLQEVLTVQEIQMCHLTQWDQ